MYLILVAYYLAILTFYIGVLIYSLPIPVTSLKRWAPRLIADAFFVMVLLFSISSIVTLSNIIQHTLGGDWNSFLSYTKASIAGRVYVLMMLGLLRDLLSKIGFLSGITRLVSMIMNSIVASLYMLLVMYTLSVVVKTSFWTFIALGLALMAIPFRIARSAGAFLLAFALVFNTALPLYMQFVKMLIFSEASSLSGFIVYGSVVNMNNKSISHGFIGLEYGNKYIAPIPVYSSIYTMLVNYEGNATLYFDVCGHMFFTNITNASIHNLCRNTYSGTTPLLCKLNLKVMGLIDYNEGIALHAFPFPSSVNVSLFTPKYIEVYLESQQDFDLYISLVDAYNIKSLSIDSNTIENVDDYIKYRWRWFDLYGRSYVLKIPAGMHKLSVSLDKDENAEVEPSESYIYMAQSQAMNSGNIPNIFDEIIRAIYIDIVGVALYITILFSVSIGFAKVLGGYAKLRMII
ncbi:hypothetical protein QPL79_01135 [Ignisphaera sp. 4213-co]|uniref:Uncharacterized protein n=1 Tax=Ignisphaera cupida TaxID=3050454 RepID=A0ABD4Z6L4_9CREN|nr:hypothetical protein [Ignisphaera sp. 4213-co]MDK6027970.1 hypothetical protein [Ignisphaera sp. 4213-co]